MRGTEIRRYVWSKSQIKTEFLSKQYNTGDGRGGGGVSTHQGFLKLGGLY